MPAVSIAPTPLNHAFWGHWWGQKRALNPRAVSLSIVDCTGRFWGSSGIQRSHESGIRFVYPAAADHHNA
jgi:hypothetical protein